jgi:hypothetical protein
LEPPRRLIERILEICATLALCAFLLWLAMGWLKEAAPYLLICAAVVLAIVIGYHVWKYLRDMGKW